MAATIPQAENPEDFIRGVCRLYEQTFGLKRGRGVFADRAGMSDRRVKALLFEGARAYAFEYLAAHEANMALRRERAAALRAELETLTMELTNGVSRAPVDRCGLEYLRGNSVPVAGLRLAGGQDR